MAAENGNGIIAPVSELKELLDINSKILERFKDRAPGTFSHCQNVKNLCEPVAKDLGLDIEKMLVAATYHDIGKIFNPGVFSENISDDNPHDTLDPKISYQLITRHVSDSMLILIEETNIITICPEILNIIARHHGDTVLVSIYNKCKDKQEHEFRYKSQKPNCVYSSILMIVDAVEATARALYNVGKINTADERRQVVQATIGRLEADHQLDEMKVGTLRLVRDRLSRELDSIYHTRVVYNSDNVEDPALQDPIAAAAE